MTSPARRLTALVVDDSAAARALLLTALAPLGIDAVEAGDGADAVRKLEAHEFDIVLTDIHMPVMDGLKLLGHVRSGARRDLPVIIVTAEGRELDRLRAERLGASGYLRKPVEAQQVVDKVREVLRIG